jgi:hypothetical protein
MIRASARRLLTLLACVTCLALTFAGTSATTASDPDNPRLDACRIIGPGGGGATMLPTISPHDPRIVLVACDMTGAYIIEDGGESWRMFNLGTGVSSFAFDPTDANVIYAGTAALWRSSDRGRTWRMMFADPARHTRALFIGDHADYVLRSNDPLYAIADDERMSIQAIAVAPDGSVTIAMSGGGVFRGSSLPGALLDRRPAIRTRPKTSFPPPRRTALAMRERSKITRRRQSAECGSLGRGTHDGLGDRVGGEGADDRHIHAARVRLERSCGDGENGVAITGGVRR